MQCIVTHDNMFADVDKCRMMWSCVEMSGTKVVEKTKKRLCRNKEIVKIKVNKMCVKTKK